MDDLLIEIYADDTDYVIDGFDCGKAALNVFLFEHMKRQHAGKVLRAYVLRTKEQQPRIMGYYTLSGSCFDKKALPSKTQQKNIPYKNVPSVTLGRLAVDQSLQGQGWGSVLVSHAMKVSYYASQAVGIHGMFVDALDEEARGFYARLGFIQLFDENANSLFYPTRSIEQLFED